jgi:DASS family divalent anion:Na+ symporter
MAKKLIIVFLGITVWFIPPPEGIEPQAWHLFAIFITTIFGVVFNAFNVLVASILALVITILTRTLQPEDAYSGFSDGIILLIVMAFLIAKAVVKSGLGQRIALLMISKFGKTTLGLGYSLMATDMIIAPAFPSNTARSGLLFPIVFSISKANGSEPDSPSAKKIGSFLMFTSMFGIGISSGMWLTAMAANPAGAAIARDFGVDINFGNWILASFVPTIVTAILIPLVIYKIFPPTIKNTPEAPAYAKQKLKEMGKLSRNEIITAIVFILLVSVWAVSDIFNIDRTAIAFLGLGLLLLFSVFEVSDIKKEGEALSTMIWFSILYTLSTYLNKLGFMGYVGDQLAESLMGISWPLVYVILVFTYIVFHYLFVSQTAHMLALFGVFLGAGISVGVPPLLLAFMLLFATNYFSVITPQGSSCNILYISSGYIKPQQVYKYGGITTFLSFILYMVFGSVWILLIF